MNLSAHEPLVFRPPHEIRDIVLVGCGGTGGQWARGLARTLYHLRQHRRHLPRLTFVDPDLVEEKNIGRQLFVAQEIGQPKAAVLARRFNAALGLDIAYFVEPFDVQKHAPSSTTLVCGAVDNHLARRELAKTSGLWIDAGNHATSGQVCLGNSSDLDQLYSMRREGNQIRWLPFPAVIFPALLDPEPTIQPSPPMMTASCAEAVQAEAQSLLINDIMGSVAADYTYRLLAAQPIHTFLTFVDISAGFSVKSIPICPAEIRAYLPEGLR